MSSLPYIAPVVTALVALASLALRARRRAAAAPPTSAIVAPASTPLDTRGMDEASTERAGADPVRRSLPVVGLGGATTMPDALFDRVPDVIYLTCSYRPRGGYWGLRVLAVALGPDGQPGHAPATVYEDLTGPELLDVALVELEALLTPPGPVTRGD